MSLHHVCVFFLGGESRQIERKHQNVANTASLVCLVARGGDFEVEVQRGGWVGDADGGGFREGRRISHRLRKSSSSAGLM